MNHRTLLIRADANVAMGTGHVMRCLALAQAWQDAGGRCIFAMAENSPSLRETLLKESFAIAGISASPGSEEDARQTAALVREHAAAWVAVDGYQFGADYQRTLQSAGCEVLFLDDYGHAGRYYAAIVLDQNISADEVDYKQREPYSRLLLGAQYCLLRREFNVWRKWRRQMASVGHRVLVTMGGSDPTNFTERAIEALALIEDDDLEAIVVVGGSNARSEALKRLASGAGRKIDFRRNVSNMAELMVWADIAISAAGTTCWEMCFLGLPALLVDLAENQAPVARGLHRRGCAIHMGSAGDVSLESLAAGAQRLLRCGEDRRAMSLHGVDLVDGLGAERVVGALRGERIRLRPARESDCRVLWDWANDPQVRASSFSPAPIPWEQHLAWFTSKMRDPACRILIGEDWQGKPIGQFRVDWRSDESADIDVSVSRECRSLGYGRVLVDLGVGHAFAERGSACLHAYVKPENQASCRSFESAHFENLGVERVNGHTAVHYLRTNKTDQE